MLRHLRLALALALATAASASHLQVSAAPARTALPTVTGPITGQIDGETAYDVRGAGYVEEEYFVSGSAASLGLRDCPYEEADPVIGTPASYKVRIVVYRPKDPRRFNGTAIAEWENVTGTSQSDPMFAWLDSYALRSGYVYVKMMVQDGSLSGDKYAPISHPGDEYAFDIFTQEVQSLTRRRGVDPIGGLKVKRVIAVGNSQSGIWLQDYAQRHQRKAGLVSAFLADANNTGTEGCDKTFKAPPPVPIIQVISMDGFVPQPEPNQTKNYRVWEIQGASHTDADAGRAHKSSSDPKRSWAAQLKFWAARHYGEEGVSGAATCAVGVYTNEFPRRYAVDAAVASLDTWVRTGRPAPQPPRQEFDATGDFPQRDEHLNGVGGLQLPPLEVPVASYIGDACGKVSGITVPLDPVRLNELYPTHAGYIAKMEASINRALKNRYMVKLDAAELLNLAKASRIGADVSPAG